MRTLLMDLRYALRLFRSHPGIFLIAVGSLALGLGATSTIFSLVDGMYLRPFPVRDPSGLVWIKNRTAEGRSGGVGWLDYLELKEAAQAFSEVSVQNRRGGQLDDPADPEMVQVTIVSDNFFPLLGVEPAHGRLFRQELDSAFASEPAVAISDSLWRRRFSADPSLVGRALRMNGRSLTVVGVLPAGFRGLDRAVRTDVWVPVSSWKAMGNQKEFEERGSGQFEGIARLRPQASLEQARAQLEALTARFREARPELYRGRRLEASTEEERQSREGVNPGTLLLAIVGLVVIISCANVAMLLLAQQEGRNREISIRLAVGASRSRLARLLLTECAALALAGVALALLLSQWLIPLLPALLPPGPAFVSYDIRMDGRVVGVTLLTCLSTVLLVGLAPALQAARTDLMSMLKGRGLGPRQSYSARNLIVIAQAALSVVLFTAAALLAQSLVNTQRQRLGFDSDKNMLVLLAFDRGPRNQVAVASEELIRRLQSVPGIKQAAYCRRSPMGSSGAGATREVVIPGRAAASGEEPLRVRYNQVSAGYFALLGTRVLAGRGMEPMDMAAALRVAWINQTLAQRYWPQGNALEQHLLVDGADTRIVGIIEDGMISRIHEAPEPFMVFPFAQLPVNEVTFFAETAGPAELQLEAVKKEMRSGNPNQVLMLSGTWKRQLHDAMYDHWLPAVLSSIIGLMGMILAAAGLFGVVLHGVNRQMRETGVRLALGAQASAIVALVLRRGLLLAGSGALIGAAVSLAAGRLIASLLFGVEPHDPLVLSLSIAVVLIMAAAASGYPAWKATRVDPATVLRAE